MGIDVAPLGVRPVPSEEELGMFEKILLAVDESDHSAKAAELAGKLATFSNGEVVVLHVHEILPTRGGPVDMRVIESNRGGRHHL